MSLVPGGQPAYAFGSTPQPQFQVITAGFSSPLCDCCADVSICCLTCWCPCVTFGQNAEIIDRGTTSCAANGAMYACLVTFTFCSCQWIYSYSYRSKLRAQYGMTESCCGDCCVHFWCSWCAVCQEHRELEHRGYNPTLGWIGNMEKQNRGMTILTMQNSTMAIPSAHAVAIPLMHDIGMGSPPTQYPGMTVAPTMPQGMNR